MGQRHSRSVAQPVDILALLLNVNTQHMVVVATIDASKLFFRSDIVLAVANVATTHLEKNSAGETCSNIPILQDRDTAQPQTTLV